MDAKEFAERQKYAHLVSRYATPLAILVVAVGLALSPPRHPQREICLGLLIFGIVFNVTITRILDHGGGAWLFKLRRWTNFFNNLVTVYLLGPYWTPIWLLVTLTPLATAITGSRRSTIVTATMTSVALIIIHSTRGHNFCLEWGQQIIYAAYIFLISLMVNDLSLTARGKR